MSSQVRAEPLPVHPSCSWQVRLSEMCLKPVCARACAWTLLAGGWGSVYSDCMIQSARFSSCKFSVLWEWSGVRWTLATAQHGRWGCKTLKVECVTAPWRTGFSLMGQGLVWSVLIVYGIVYPARTAVDGISGSPPAGFTLYYAALM